LLNANFSHRSIWLNCYFPDFQVRTSLNRSQKNSVWLFLESAKMLNRSFNNYSSLFLTFKGNYISLVLEGRGLRGRRNSNLGGPIV
jgi:hypothetical protein